MSRPKLTGPVVSETGNGLLQSSPGCTHRPAEHEVRGEQTVPQLPQFSGSVARLTQAPAHAVPPPPHELMFWHEPLEHVSLSLQ